MNRKRGYLLILLSALLYSTTEVSLKLLTGMFAPMQLTAERVLIGALVLLPFALRNLKAQGERFTRADWLYFILTGFVAVGSHMVFLQLAVMRIDASVAATLYSGSPIVTVLCAHFLLREPMKKQHVAALFLMFLGILAILDPRNLTLDLWGFLFIMIATVGFGAYAALCKLRTARFDGVTISCFVLLVGAAQLFAMIFLGKIEPVAQTFERIGLDIFARVPLTEGFTLTSTLALLYVGAIVAGVGYFLTAQITRDTSATEASFVYLLKPIFATAVAHFILHEPILPNRIVGIAFYTAASLTAALPLLIEMKKERMP
ncbi:MAG: DMT family transporter [Oscillospiraceae bacterium]|nr:DMT family transporter [Oscillospiraceae bacterium]